MIWRRMLLVALLAVAAPASFAAIASFASPAAPTGAATPAPATPAPATSAAAAPGAAHCVPVRVGYMDQHRPPYWMGDGPVVPNPPGSGVDLMHDAIIGAGFGCEPTWVRLPMARLRVALAAGDIDMAPIGEMASYPDGIVLPRNKDGTPDNRRATENHVMVLVRAADKLPPGIQPMEYFKGKVLGVAQGQSYAPRLREAGLTLDEGARDLERNLEKLRLGRVDGVVAAAVMPGHVKLMLARYNGSIVQLPQPLITTHAWMAFNETYYRAHRPQVEALWTWLDVNRGKLGYVMDKYRKQD